MEPDSARFQRGAKWGGTRNRRGYRLTPRTGARDARRSAGASVRIPSSRRDRPKPASREEEPAARAGPSAAGVERAVAGEDDEAQVDQGGVEERAFESRSSTQRRNGDAEAQKIPDSDSEL